MITPHPAYQSFKTALRLLLKTYPSAQVHFRKTVGTAFYLIPTPRGKTEAFRDRMQTRISLLTGHRFGTAEFTRKLKDLKERQSENTSDAIALYFFAKADQEFWLTGREIEAELFFSKDRCFSPQSYESIEGIKIAPYRYNSKTGTYGSLRNRQAETRNYNINLNSRASREGRSTVATKNEISEAGDAIVQDSDRPDEDIEINIHGPAGVSINAYVRVAQDEAREIFDEEESRIKIKIYVNGQARGAGGLPAMEAVRMTVPKDSLWYHGIVERMQEIATRVLADDGRSEVTVRTS